MTISVFGLGYVGCVAAASLARSGHTVLGVDINPEKVALVTAGRSPVIEPGLDDVVRDVVKAGRLHATADAQAAVAGSDMSIVCVGTPSHRNGSLNLQYVESVCRDIGAALASRHDYHVVVVRSTVLPGTVEKHLVPLLEHHSGRKAGRDFGVAMNPEFLREGTALHDYARPPLIVIGEWDAPSGDAVHRLYDGCEAAVVRTTIQAAEMVKYASNAFHAVKVVFANELGNLCEAHGIDGQKLMEMFCQDRQLNISPAYLKPGFAFGGSCLPKDLRALLYRAKERDLECPLLNAATESNQQQIERGIQRIEETGRRKIGVLGLSFKAGTDDVRESAMVDVAQALLGRGYQLRIYDPALNPGALIGANKRVIETKMPHLASLLTTDLAGAIGSCGVIVAAQKCASIDELQRYATSAHHVIDVNGWPELRELPSRYEGFCW